MSKPTTRPPPGRGPGLQGRPSGDSLSEFMPTLEECESLVSEEEADKRRPTASRVAAARAVMAGAESEAAPVQPNSPWAKAAAEKPIDKSALPSASGPAMDTPGAVAPVTAPIGVPEGRGRKWPLLPTWAYYAASAVLVLSPLVMWLIVSNAPPRHPVETEGTQGALPAAPKQTTAPVSGDGGAPASVQGFVPAPSATPSVAPSAAVPQPERPKATPKPSSTAYDPYGPDAATKPLPVVTAVPTVAPVAPPPVAPVPTTPAPPKSATPPAGPTPMFEIEKEKGS
jgi:hypothetical protein